MLPLPQMYPARQDPGVHSNKLMALQPQGPTAQDHLTTTGNTRLRLDTLSNPDDENARSGGVSTYLRKFFATTNIPARGMPIRIHCKTSSLSARLVFETRSNCQDFVARFKDDGLPYAVDSPFDRTVRQSMSPEDKEIGRRFKPLWEVVLVPKYGNFSRW